jgi:hypothetical protein
MTPEASSALSRRRQALGQGDLAGQVGVGHAPVRLQQAQDSAVDGIELDGRNGLHRAHPSQILRR